MATPYPYVSGAVLTAAQLNDGQNLPINDVTANYVLVNNDRYKRVIMNNAGSTTITVNNNVFVTGDVIQISNKGAGSTVITAGAGVTVNTAGSLTLAQYGGGYLLALSASTFTFFSGGAPAYGTATGGIGAPTSVTISGINYQYLTFTSTGTLTVTRAGFFDYLLVGGGNGHTSQTSGIGSGGGAGAIVIGSIYLSSNQTVTIGAGSSFANFGNLQQAGNTSIAATSPFTQTASGAVCKNDASSGDALLFVGSGNGSFSSVATTGVSTIYGNNGGVSRGGGGGFGGAGVSGLTTGNGGAGYDISVFIGGSALFKASGGGGGQGSAQLGGSGLGNNGSTNTTPSNGAANSGCGGGAGQGTPTTGNGGSGIAYVRWKV